MKVKATLVLAGAVALACATTVATAAKPELTGKQKKDMAAQVREHQKKAARPQPKTMAESNAAKLQSAATGAQGQLVATDLWSTLHAHTDADGKLRVLESEGDLAPNTEGLPNE